MSSSSSRRVTELLDAIGSGDRPAADELLPLVYDEMRKLARWRLARDTPGRTGYTKCEEITGKMELSFGERLREVWDRVPTSVELFCRNGVVTGSWKAPEAGRPISQHSLELAFNEKCELNGSMTIEVDPGTSHRVGYTVGEVLRH